MRYIRICMDILAGSLPVPFLLMVLYLSIWWPPLSCQLKLVAEQTVWKCIASVGENPVHTSYNFSARMCDWYLHIWWYFVTAFWSEKLSELWHAFDFYLQFLCYISPQVALFMNVFIQRILAAQRTFKLYRILAGKGAQSLQRNERTSKRNIIKWENSHRV